jgi:hypothetical protein
MPIAFELAPANVPDREAVSELLEGIDLSAGHGGGVDESQVVAPRGRDPRQPGEQADDLRGKRPDALVAARPAGNKAIGLCPR